MAPLIPYTLHTARNRTVLPLIIFVHHYGGSEKILWRHVELVNQLGADCVTFNLSRNTLGLWPLFPFRAQKKWARELSLVLTQIDESRALEPGRKKIIYAFSGPSASAIECIARRFAKGKFDIDGFICDSGPFYDPWVCTREMLKEVEGRKNAILRELVLSYMMLRWDLWHSHTVRKNLRKLAKLNPDLPLLSIQGAHDYIVPPSQIQKVFEGMPLTRYQARILLEAGHLTGLKFQPGEYEKLIREFLRYAVPFPRI